MIVNRQIGSVNTFPGNLVQCSPITSPNKFVPGQFPIAAVDGAASTKWQPILANDTSSITVSLPDAAISSKSRISGFAFDWAQAPPLSARILLHDAPLSSPGAIDLDSAHAPSGTFVVAADLPSIAVSNPYDPMTTDLNEIVPYRGNTTNVTLDEPVPVARFATLLVRGSQALGQREVKAGNGTGATVAEWSILGEEGQEHDVRRLRVRGGSWREDL